MSIDQPENLLLPVYNELRRKYFGENKFGVLVAVGHSPVKALLLPEELSQKQRQEWDVFITHPLQGNEQGREPEFRVLGGTYLETIRDIQDRSDIDDETKNKLVIAKRIELQHTGRLVLNRISRINALAAGLALYLGLTNKLILSGAGTIPKQVSGDTVNLPQDVFDNTPSEAEMMKDIILKTYGRLMFERDIPQVMLNKKYTEQFGLQVDYETEKYKNLLEDEFKRYFNESLFEKIGIEGKSVNTLENFGEILKNWPDLRSAAIIFPGFHLERLQSLAKLHSIDIEPFGALRDADLLKARAALRNKKTYVAMLDFMNDPLRSEEQAFRVNNDNKWLRALIEPKRIGYWLGYITELDRDRLQNVIDMIASTLFREPAREAFVLAGLEFDKYTSQPLSELSIEDVQLLRDNLKKTFHGKGKPAREKAVDGL